MPSVTPSDGGYQQYQRLFEELEDDMRDEVKRLRERDDDRTARLEERYRTQLAEREKETEETVNNMRERASEHLGRERQTSKSELENLRRQVYDRSGRFSSAEESSRREVEELQRALIAEGQKNQDITRDLQESAERKLAERSQALRDEGERALEAARETAQADNGRMTEDERREFERLRAKTAEDYANLDRTRQDDLSVQRRMMERTVQAAKDDYQHRAQVDNASAELTEESRRAAEKSRHEQQIRNLRDVHTEEARDLRQQIKNLVEEGNRYSKEKGSGTAEAVRAYENEYRKRQQLLNDSYERVIDKYRRENNALASRYARINSDNAKEKDAHFAHVVNRQNAETHNRMSDMGRTFQADRDLLEGKLKTERRENGEILRKELTEADRRQHTALDEQARNYEKSLARQRELDGDKVKKLEEALRETRTSSDTSVISPALEAKMNKQIAADYEKKFAAEQQRNKRGTDSIQTEYSRRLIGALAERDARDANIARGYQSERNFDRSQFHEHVNELSFVKDMAVKTADEEHRREIENLNRSHAMTLERQRREYEEMLSSQRDDANSRVQAIRQESDFKEKMSHRAFTARQNELIREFDKKLADQKQDYETLMEQLTARNQQQLREMERKGKTTLEEQERSYEHRIAQLEYQHKERERYIGQNYQEELEKIKRSNALLIQKKS